MIWLYMKIISKAVVLLGMMFIAFSKEKDEDELTMLIRMKALASAFVYIVIFKIVSDVFGIIDQELIENKNGYFFQMMIWYFFVYYSAKLLR